MLLTKFKKPSQGPRWVEQASPVNASRQYRKGIRENVEKLKKDVTIEEFLTHQAKGNFSHYTYDFHCRKCKLDATTITEIKLFDALDRLHSAGVREVPLLGLIATVQASDRLGFEDKS